MIKENFTTWRNSRDTFYVTVNLCNPNKQDKLETKF